jgi:hypothetical protein
MSGLLLFSPGCRNWLALAAMVALLVAMDFALLPEHSDVYMFSVMTWAFLLLVVRAASKLQCRWIDILRGDA